MKTGQVSARDLGDWCQNPPQVRGGEFFIRAFWELSTERPRRGAPIPWSRLVQYAALYGLERDVMDLFVFVLREMDEEWLKFQAEDSAPSPKEED